ncbi:MAG: type II toxin-antitoxin system RelE family toxin [Thermoplasmataceae archaeon]
MTSYEVLISQTAAKELKALEGNLQVRIKEKLMELAEDPSNRSGRLDIKKLSTTRRHYYRLRVGEYRIIFFTEKKSIKVVRIANRSNVYYWLD